jgi:hypothetical protein
MEWRRSNVSLRERPASIKRRVRSVATSVELPALEDASTETLTMRGPPLRAKSYYSVVAEPQGASGLKLPAWFTIDL